jgi:hypothetical protein
MPITYTIDSEQKLITELWTGEIQAADLAEYWKQYLGDLDVMAIRRTIVDLRQAVILFKGSDMDNLIQSIVLPALKGKDWKTAIVVDNPTQFGISRQYQAFAHLYSKDAIFHSMEEAQSWLCGSDSMKIWTKHGIGGLLNQ